MRVTAFTRGFSLIEVTVAAAVLALGCLGSAGVLEVALRAEDAGFDRAEAYQVLDAEAVRLQALPFFRPAAGPEARPDSLLAEVFPHARRAANRPPDCFGDDSGTAVFVTEVRAGGLLLRRTARLVRDEAGEPQAVSEAAVQGWAVWVDQRPPALAVELTLAIVDGGSGTTGGTAQRRLLLRAFRPERDQTVAVRGSGAPATSGHES